MTERLPDLDELALFVAVARAGSMGRAAKAQDLSQPVVSRRIAALERRLKVTLLTRSKQGSTVTAAGKVVADWADSLLEQAEGFSRSVRTLREEGGGEATIAVSMTIAEHIAPGWFAALRTVSPETHVSMQVTNSAAVIAAVLGGQADLGFVEGRRTPDELQRRKLATDRLLVAVAPDHAWARSGVVGLADFVAAPLLVREQGSGTRETLDFALAEMDAFVRPQLEMPSNSALRSAAVAGLGPVVLSERALAGDLERGSLIEVGVAGLEMYRDFHAVWRTDEPLSPGATAVLQVAIA